MQPVPPGPAPTRGAGFALAFVLGGGFVALAGAAVVAAFLLGRHQSGAVPGDAGATTAPTSDAAAAVVIATATADAGASGGSADAAQPASTKATRAGTKTIPQSDGGAAKPPSTAKCTCVSERNNRICPTPMVPSCRCWSESGGFTLCPTPWVGLTATTSATCPRGYDLYSSKPGRKDKDPCSGFLSNDGTRAVPGVADCNFCYGRDKVAGVAGGPCRGTNAGGEVVDGKLFCDP
jgi:hypothetical protein